MQGEGIGGTDYTDIYRDIKICRYIDIYTHILTSVLA